MSRRFLKAGIIALCVLGGMVILAVQWHAGRARRYFGGEAWRVVQEAEQVEVVRLRTEFPDSEVTGRWVRKPRPVRRRRVGLPVTPSSDWVRRLKRVLNNPNSYSPEHMRSCIPLPGVGAEFHRGAEQVDVLFCFECSMISIAPPGQVKWNAFDPARAQLVRLMKEVFPRDREVQAMSERF